MEQKLCVQRREVDAAMASTVPKGTMPKGAVKAVAIFEEHDVGYVLDRVVAAGVLIFLAFGIKCAVPLLHNWLQDAYPEATVTGTVWLSAFTTKLAVYSLARGYAGTEILVPIGAAMTAFPSGPAHPTVAATAAGLGATPR